MDLDYHEEKEAEFILKAFNVLGKIRFDILKIIDKMSNGSGNDYSNKRSYFG